MKVMGGVLGVVIDQGWAIEARRLVRRGLFGRSGLSTFGGLKWSRVGDAIGKLSHDF